MSADVDPFDSPISESGVVENVGVAGAISFVVVLQAIIYADFKHFRFSGRHIGFWKVAIKYLSMARKRHLVAKSSLPAPPLPPLPPRSRYEGYSQL